MDEFEYKEKKENTESEALNEEPEIKAPLEETGVTASSSNFEKFIFSEIETEYIKEKRQIKKSASAVGLSFLCFYGFVIIINILSSVFLQLLGALAPELQNYLGDPAVETVSQIVFSLSAFTLPFIFMAKVSGFRISNLISFKKPEKKDILPFILIGNAFCAFANIAVSEASYIFSRFGIDYNVDYGENPKGVFGFLLSVIATAIVPALVEEFAIRGVILGILKKHGEGFAIICTAIVFGLMHGNFEQMPFAFLCGLALGFITVKSGTIVIAMAVHGLNNLISVLMDYFVSSLPTAQANMIYTGYLMISLVLGILAILLSRFKSSDIYKFAPCESKLNEKQKYKYFFVSAPIIIYAAICFIESLSFFVL